MEVRKNRKKPAAALLLVILAILGFAYITTRMPGSVVPMQDMPVGAPDTTKGNVNQQQDSVFRSIMSQADKMFREKKYDDALLLYEKARGLKPADATIKNKIVQATALSAQQKKTDEEFSKLMASADQYFSAKAYMDAKATYQLALNLKPDDPYAQKRLDETMGYLRSQKAQNILYDVAVANADKFYEAGDLDKARTEYEKASQILPGDQYAKDKINEILKIQVDKQVREELYNQAITKADQLYNQKKYQGALTEYKNALKQKPDEPYPQERIRELTEILNQLKAVDEAYQKALAIADQYFVVRRYPEAKTGYQDALKIKPDEAYPKNRIKEIDQILAGVLRVQEDYDKYITLADSLYIEKNFLRARQNYQMALQVKPNEAYPKEMIAKTEQGMSAMEQGQKAMDEAYAASVASADKLLGEKAYDPARKEYENALALKPGEAYPKSKIAEIDRILAGIAKQRSIDEQYAGVISEADQLFADQAYAGAKTQYQEASAIKPAEQYPKTKIAEIDGIFAEQARQQKEFDDRYAGLIATGDRLFAAKTYEEARKSYTEALGLKPAENYPQQQIAKIDAALGEIAKQKAIDNQYAGVIASADQLLSDKHYEEAKAKYNEALAIKPTEAYPKTRLAEIDRIFAELAKQRSIDEQYAGVISEADQLFSAKAYADAKTKYQGASAIKPEEQYPKTRIAEIDGIIAERARQQKELDDQYAALIATGDNLFAAKTYPEARKSYSEALGLKPAEKYPQDRIAAIDGILGEMAKQKVLDDQYAALIESADRLLSSKTYADARSKYTEALGLKPAEQYPKTKIGEIDAALDAIAKEQALEEQYAGFIAEGDKLLGEKSYPDARARYQSASGLKPSEGYPKKKMAEIDAILGDLARQKAIDDQYAGEVAKADKSFAAKAYDEALMAYNTALTLKPAEQYPKDKIAEIGKIKADIAAQKALDENYAGMIANADKLLAAKSYEDARKGYNDALALKPEEQYPQDKIAEIDGILGAFARQKALDEQYMSLIASADRLLASKTYAEARTKYTEALGLKPSEQYPKTKIAEIDAALDAIAKQQALDDQYQGLLAEGDKLLAEKSYDPAKLKYQSALGLKPSEEYPKQKIAGIDDILADIAKQKALDEQYAAVIGKADQSLAAKAYDDALSSYNAALILKPSEQYPKDKITEIGTIKADIAAQKALDDRYAGMIAGADKLFASKSYDNAKKGYNDALALKPAERYPQDKIAEIDVILAEMARQKALDDQYDNLIKSADQLLAAKTYAEARSKYTEALGLKPGEQYPKTKIGEIDGIFARQKAIDDQYAGIIAKADQLRSEKSYPEARTEYQNALKVKPAETYPQDKISEIDAILAELNRQKTINDRFKAQVTKADQLFNSKQYDQARTEYVAAREIKADEQYPNDRIAEIDNILSELRAKEEAYRAAVAKADQLLADKSYEPARTEYQNASAIKPMEQYPKDKIGEINRMLTEIQGKKVTYDNLLKSAGDFLADKEYNKSKEQYQQASGIFPEESFPKERIAWITRTVDSIYRVNKADYDKAVANGDKSFASFEFDKAIDAYTEASGYLPMENYPKEQIAKIRRTISENAIVDVLKTPVTIAAGDEKKFSFEPVAIASRKDNFVYLRIRNLSGKPFNILMRYGRDAQANGGVVIRNVTTDGKINERLISVRDQDLWYRADNNWLSLFPQGGDIEVSFIQVSKVR